jgi:hypothetical protein
VQESLCLRITFVAYKLGNTGPTVLGSFGCTSLRSLLKSSASFSSSMGLEMSFERVVEVEEVSSCLLGSMASKATAEEMVFDNHKMVERIEKKVEGESESEVEFEDRSFMDRNFYRIGC